MAHNISHAGYFGNYSAVSQLWSRSRCHVKIAMGCHSKFHHKGRTMVYHSNSCTTSRRQSIGPIFDDDRSGVHPRSGQPTSMVPSLRDFERKFPNPGRRCITRSLPCDSATPGVHLEDDNGEFSLLGSIAHAETEFQMESVIFTRACPLQTPSVHKKIVACPRVRRELCRLVRGRMQGHPHRVQSKVCQPPAVRSNLLMTCWTPHWLMASLGPFYDKLPIQAVNRLFLKAAPRLSLLILMGLSLTLT